MSIQSPFAEMPRQKTTSTAIRRVQPGDAMSSVNEYQQKPRRSAGLLERDHFFSGTRGMKRPFLLRCRCAG
ncbi:hypothetical protein [Pseudomonas sp. SIMBA_068]|uniref:hypothetical protein n=1 Tax=Pseudomonas sp. SIMBA_068 TaxID=3085808 RepID=UPI00397E42CE